MREIKRKRTTEMVTNYLDGSVVYESACQSRRHGFDPWIRNIPWRRKWYPTPVLLPGKSHGQRSLGAVANGVAKETPRSTYACKVYNTKWILKIYYTGREKVNISPFSV